MAMKIRDDSLEAHTSRLDIFSEYPVDTGIESVQIMEIRPTATSSQGTCIEINCPNTTSSYIDLYNTKLHVKAQILDAKGDIIPAEKVQTGEDGSEERVANEAGKYCIGDMFLSTMFRQVDVSLQQYCLTPYTGTNYPYKAYMDLLFFSSDEYRNGEANNMMYFGQYHYYEAMEDLDPATTDNLALSNAWEYCMNSRVFDMEGHIFADPCQSIDRYILDNVTLNMKFYKSDPAFCLSSGADNNHNYTVKIVDMYLKVPFVKPTAAVLLAQARLLKDHNAIYPFESSVIKSFSLGMGERSTVLSDFFNGDIPSYLIFGMVSTNAYMGDLKSNCFKFNHFGLNYLSCQLDGHSIPQGPLYPKFVKDSYQLSNIASAYSNIFLGQVKPCISRSEFCEGTTLFSFEISKTRKGCKTPQKRGFLKLEVHFKNALTEGITILLYGRFQSEFQIDSSRNIIR